MSASNETLIVRANAFTRHIEDGYTVDTMAYRRFRKESAPLKPLARFYGAGPVSAWIAANPKSPVEFLYV